MTEREIIRVKAQDYLVLHRQIINYQPKPCDVYAQLQVCKPVRGQVVYAVDEVYVGKKESRLTGLAFLDNAILSQPRLDEYTYKLRPDRELPQGDLERKTQEKSPCCNRTMHYVERRRFCRKCNKEVL